MNTPLDKSKTSVSDAESERIVQQALDNLINSSEHTVMAVDKFHKNEKDKDTPSDKSKTLSKAEQKAVAKFHKNEKDKAAIKSANIKRMKEAASHDIETIETKLFSPPVKKILFATNKVDPFQVGDYVRLKSDFSPNIIRPAGTGWVTQTLKKDDGSFYLSVQYQLDNTKHGMIPISDVTTIRQSRSELKRKAAEDCGRDAQKISKTTISQSFKAKSKIEILKSALSEGLVKKKTKGWHRLEFGLNEKENNGKKFLRLNPMEKTQLLHEYELLSQHLKDTKMNKHRRRVKKNGKFKANNKNIKINPISMDYFFILGELLGKLYHT